MFKIRIRRTVFRYSYKIEDKLQAVNTKGATFMNIHGTKNSEEVGLSGIG